jgi:hypothetical protein
MRILLLPLLTLLCACAGGGAAATNSRPPSPHSAAAASVGISVVFSAEEIKIIRAYYESGGRRHKGRHKGLPPGIAKNLQRGKPLPPGLAKRTLPDGLLAKLPPPPSGYDRFVVAGKILLVELGTQIVRDVLTDIAFG